MANKENGISKLWTEIHEYLDLKVEYIKLTAAEKASILLATLITLMVCIVFGITILFFLTLAAANWIGESLGMPLAYCIMTGFYLLLLVLVAVFRRQIIFDPIARMLSKLIFK